MIKHYNITRPY